ncbi:hypothetical protein QYE76_016437 [Lolium multiflorum]|uniref:Arabidopsis retrotransposon Orf1 C-terminal domain-containing protein n=1 Tax=Lolium multiflorum TaxID=4521 RepID=A0AAD8VE26_LOLMU|nr:hypothetical protein QYE76_016437 [Lolium multiflorum]
MTSLRNEVWGKPETEQKDLTTLEDNLRVFFGKHKAVCQNTRQLHEDLRTLVLEQKAEDQQTIALLETRLKNNEEQLAKRSSIDSISIELEVLKAEHASLQNFLKEFHEKETKAKKEPEEKHAQAMSELAEKLKTSNQRVKTLVSRRRLTRNSTFRKISKNNRNGPIFTENLRGQKGKGGHGPHTISRRDLEGGRATLWKRTPDEAEELLARISQNHDDWTTPEPTPTSVLKRGYMKDIVSNKRKIPNEDISTMFANYSFNGKVPKKLGDPGTAKKIEKSPKALTELYREVTNDDSRTIQRGKIRNIQLPAIRYFAYYLATSILGRENTSNISSYHLAFLVAALTGSTPYHLGALIARRLSTRGPIYGGIIASRILAHLDLPLDPTDEKLTPVRLDIAAMKSHQFITTDSSLENIVYKMLFIDGDEREIPLPQADLFNVHRRPWSRSKEEVDEQLRIHGFHQQHDSEDAEPSYGYTVTYPGASSSAYPEQDPSSSYYGDATSWRPWD